MLKENCGSQDQIWAAYGGFNIIKFNKDGKFFVYPIKKSKKNLNKLDKNMFLVYTGINRFSENIEKDNLYKLYKEGLLTIKEE